MKDGQRRGEIASRESNRRYDIVPERNYMPRTLSDLGVTRKDRGMPDQPLQIGVGLTSFGPSR